VGDGTVSHFNVAENTILYVRHGSRAYGTDLPTSDHDFKGVCVAPQKCVIGFAYNFEQQIDGESTVYDLRKFMRLAADCNPNIIEILFADDADVLTITSVGRRLRDARGLFLSRKARHTFAGYAYAQLKKIKTHRRWLLEPPAKKPEREDFGLSTLAKLSSSMLGAADELAKQGHELDANALEIVDAEKRYIAAHNQWQQYERWKRERNPQRAELEARNGYDTKYAMHLVRLMRMCREILRGEGVVVRRPDAQELLAIRAGAWSYDELVGYAESLDAELATLYETSALPWEPDRDALNALCVDLHQWHWDWAD
jgi:predicted nucleotidyltransferase